MSRANIEVVMKGLSLGEGPHWVEKGQELLYVDIMGQALHRYVPETKQHKKIPIDGRTTIIVPVANERNKYIVGVDRNLSLATLEWDEDEPEASRLDTIFCVEQDYPKNRFNDGKCDPQGRLWAGTMGHETTVGNVDPEKGNLYSLGLEGQLRNHVDKIGISNGLTWTTDSSKFFYIDSVAYTVDVFDFDFDAEQGTLSNRRVFYDFKKNGIKGLPDGMTTDAQNNLWVAAVMGGKILHIDTTTGTLMDEINFEGRASKVTSLAFGGPHLDTLYVTSAAFGITPEEMATTEPDAGALFQVTNVGAKGLAGGVSFNGKLGQP